MPAGLRAAAPRRGALSGPSAEPVSCLISLGSSDLKVTPICLGTMTFGEQVDEPTSHAIMDRAIERLSAPASSPSAS